MTKRLPYGAPDALPTTRFEVAPKWRLAVLPLSLGRGRIVHTDGAFVDEFW